MVVRFILFSPASIQIAAADYTFSKFLVKMKCFAVVKLFAHLEQTLVVPRRKGFVYFYKGTSELG
jgi:hypothetical protein